MAFACYMKPLLVESHAQKKVLYDIELLYNFYLKLLQFRRSALIAEIKERKK